MCVEEDTPTFGFTIHTLVHVLSSIQSTRLKTAELHVVFNFEEFPCEGVPVTPPATESAFLLADQLRPVCSRGGPGFGITLFLDGDDDAASPVLDAALDVLPQFFAPWDERGMLDVMMPRLYQPQAEREANLESSGSRVSSASSTEVKESMDATSSVSQAAPPSPQL